jgi:hypothetical protein
VSRVGLGFVNPKFRFSLEPLFIIFGFGF